MGPQKGSELTVHAGGFRRDSIVYWKLMTKDGFIINTIAYVPITGWFKTDNSGGFNNIIQVENLGWDLDKGVYNILFGNDSDKDTEFDAGIPATHASLRIPC